ncbi:MAG TPA: hypothetical protein IAB18_04970 [Candidatus Avisuccinivibrio pullicola]|nr:hypothetical protein [Candidatus Avisuccinivibrio pullicola]
MTCQELKERGAALQTEDRESVPDRESSLAVEHEYAEVRDRAEALLERYATLFYNLTYR